MQEFLPESPQDFYSATSSDECSFKPADEGPARLMVLHLDGRMLNSIASRDCTRLNVRTLNQTRYHRCSPGYSWLELAQHRTNYR